MFLVVFCGFDTDFLIYTWCPIGDERLPYGFVSLKGLTWVFTSVMVLTNKQIGRPIQVRTAWIWLFFGLFFACWVFFVGDLEAL